MLKKLIKYEWKEVSKIGCILLGVILLVTILGSVFAFTLEPGMNRVDANEGYYIMYMFGLMGTFMLYVIALMVAIYGIYIYLGVRFYKTMYGDEGYLMHTLPVKPVQLLNSKLIVGGLWTLIITICICLSIVVLGLNFAYSFVMSQMTYGEVIKKMAEGIVEAFSIGPLRFLGIQYLFILFVSPFTSLMLLFGSLSIGQLSSKHRGFIGILVYFGVVALSGVVGSILNAIIMVATMAIKSDAFGYMGVGPMSSAGSVIAALIVSATMYFVAKNIIANKLNLE